MLLNNIWSVQQYKHPSMQNAYLLFMHVPFAYESPDFHAEWSLFHTCHNKIFFLHVRLVCGLHSGIYLGNLSCRFHRKTYSVQSGMFQCVVSRSVVLSSIFHIECRKTCLPSEILANIVKWLNFELWITYRVLSHT